MPLLAVVRTSVGPFLYAWVTSPSNVALPSRLQHRYLRAGKRGRPCAIGVTTCFTACACHGQYVEVHAEERHFAKESQIAALRYKRTWLPVYFWQKEPPKEQPVDSKHPTVCCRYPSVQKILYSLDEGTSSGSIGSINRRPIHKILLSA